MIIITWAGHNRCLLVTTTFVATCTYIYSVPTEEGPVETEEVLVSADVNGGKCIDHLL